MTRADKRQQLVDHYLDFYRYALAMVRDEQDACDVVQEALVKTLVRPALKDPVGYCKVTVKTLSIKMVARRRRFVPVEEEMARDDSERDALIRIVAEKKAELPEMARAVLELHYEEGLTLPEVAKMTGLNLSKLKRILADAKEEMIEKLKYEI